MTLILFILILGILVIIHELGHFIAAKKTGVRVEEFGFGFPPRVFGKKIGETLYSFNLIPFGGFVKLYGEEYAELQSKSKTTDQSKAFVYKKPFVKALIIVGGVLMNFLLAIILYYVTFSVNNFKSEPLPLIKEYHFRFGNQENRVAIGAVVEGSPASKTQIESGDLVFRAGVESKQAKLVWKSIYKPEQFIELVKNSQNKTLYLDIENSINGEKKTITVVPLYDSKLKRAVIGINLVEAAIISYDSVPERLLSGVLHSYNVSAYNIEGIRFLFSESAKNKSLEPVAEGSAGPIGIFRIIDEMVKSSGKKLVINLLNLLALLSLSLGVINILPFPALDGGRFVMILYEWVTGKRINAMIEKYLIVGGFILLMALAVLVTINDILKMIARP